MFLQSRTPKHIVYLISSNDLCIQFVPEYWLIVWFAGFRIWLHCHSSLRYQKWSSDLVNIKNSLLITKTAPKIIWCTVHSVNRRQQVECLLNFDWHWTLPSTMPPIFIWKMFIMYHSHAALISIQSWLLSMRNIFW